VQAKHEAMRAAAARVDSAIVAWVPRVSGLARYTRLSPITPPVLGQAGVNSVSVLGGTPGQPLPANATLVATPPFSFPVILDNYLIQGSLTVPLSDYFLRISHSYAAASHNEEAARLDKIASEAKSMSDGKIAFYNWIKAVGQREVLQQALVATQEHVKDAEALFKAGQASKADLLSAQSQVAAGQLTVMQADEFVRTAEEQLRIITRAADNETIVLGEDVTVALPPAATDLAALRQEALTNRPELRALGATERSLEQVASVARASSWPQISGFGDVIYANPNSRIFPSQSVWRATWDVGLQLTWSPNDAVSGVAAGAEADANAAKLRAQRAQLRDGVALEVAQAVFALKTADLSVETSNLGLASAEEAYRVRREAYKVGRATSVELTDAEASLFRARLTAVNARIDQRIARIRLEHTTGRDVAKLPTK
jgi:outer membrane protein TolC